MKTSYLFIVLFNVIYLTKAEETWSQSKSNKLSDNNLKRLEKLAKITQNAETFALEDTNVQSYRLTRDLPLIESQSRKLKEKTSESSKNESEVNNFVSEDESQTTRSTAHAEIDETTTYNFYPSRKGATSKRKTPAKLTVPPKLGVSDATPKPTKYHYYPHNQHIYLLPECAVQQVCNAVYVRLNYTQPLCACPSRKEPCSASLNADDQHTTELVTAKSGKVLTLVKTCEPVTEMRVCRAPRDWSLLALQNIRTGKSHYLVICRCPNKGRLEGPMSHDQPAYASVPGIRVYGMMCIRDSYRINRSFRYRRSLKGQTRQIPWKKVKKFNSSLQW